MDDALAASSSRTGEGPPGDERFLQNYTETGHRGQLSGEIVQRPLAELRAGDLHPCCREARADQKRLLHKKHSCEQKDPQFARQRCDFFIPLG